MIEYKNMKSEIKPVAIIIYGAVAVGKLTIGTLLAKKLKYKLTHNHLINDLVWSIFERGTPESAPLIEKLRYDFYEKAIKSGKNIVITHAYAHDYISKTGLSDPQYLKTLEKKLEKSGAKVLFVHLRADNKILLKRVTSESRKNYKKLTNTKSLKELLTLRDFTTSAPVKNNLVIDNTNLEPKKVVQMIINHLK